MQLYVRKVLRYVVGFAASADVGVDTMQTSAFLMLQAFGFPDVPEVYIRAAGDAIDRTGTVTVEVAESLLTVGNGTISLSGEWSK